MRSTGKPLKPHHLVAAVVDHGETLVVQTVYMAVAKVQHLIITFHREISLLGKAHRLMFHHITQH